MVAIANKEEGGLDHFRPGCPSFAFVHLEASRPL